MNKKRSVEPFHIVCRLRLSISSALRTLNHALLWGPTEFGLGLKVGDVQLGRAGFFSTKFGYCNVKRAANQSRSLNPMGVGTAAASAHCGRLLELGRRDGS